MKSVMACSASGSASSMVVGGGAMHDSVGPAQLRSSKRLASMCEEEVGVAVHGRDEASL